MAKEAPVEVSTRIEYSELLQWIKAKDYIKALARMEVDVEEYGRFLRDAKDSHLSEPEDVLEFVIKSKFFDSVKVNQKHISAIYAVLYAALSDETREALHFLLIHTSSEFDSLCNGIVSASLAMTNAQLEPSESSDGANPEIVRSDVSSDMLVITTLAKLFEAVDRMMNEYAYVESFGLKRNLLILRILQPILEKHAMVLMSHWLRTSKFDEYAMVIPSNDWKLYEAYQLSKLENPSSASHAAQPPSSPSPSSTQPQTVPSVRVGGKLDPMKVVLSLDQFASLSQLVETYKAYIHRLYEKGIEEMMAKGHTFVDKGETSEIDRDGVPFIPSTYDTEHNIRAYVCEPTQLFTFVQRKSESYKQLEIWFLGSALLSAHTPSATATSPLASSSKSEGQAKEHGEKVTEAERREESERLWETPTHASVYAVQKIDQVFALLMRSLERSFSTKQAEVAQTMARRAVALCPSFLLSMFIRAITTSLPKSRFESTIDIASAILDFHGEPLDLAKNLDSSTSSPSAAPIAKESPSPSQGTSPAKEAAPSIWKARLGGFMNFVGSNASSVVSSAASGVISGHQFGVSDEMLVTAPSREVWKGCNAIAICAALNDLALCSRYFPRLYNDLEKKVKYFEKNPEKREAVLAILVHFKESLPPLFNVATSLQPLTEVMVPGVAYYMHQFWRTSYEVGEEEYKAMELNDPWALAACNWMKSNMTVLKDALNSQVMELWTYQVAEHWTRGLEKLILRKRFSAFGALSFDSHLRTLSACFTSLLQMPTSGAYSGGSKSTTSSLSAPISSSLRHLFATLKEITTILSLNSEGEILEIWNASHDDPSQFLDPSSSSTPSARSVTVRWRLSPTQVKAYMNCRTEWNSAKIQALPLS